eukprot:4975474-Pyramimonas_sp.AAC.1
MGQAGEAHVLVAVALRDGWLLAYHAGSGHLHAKGKVLTEKTLSNANGPRWGPEGIYRSSLDARKPQNPTKSEEYQGHLQ